MDFDANVLVTGCRYGDMLVNKYDSFAGRSIRAYGEWAQTEVDITSALLTAGDVVLDIGANVGTFTLPYGKAVGPTGHVHAVEPQRLLFQLLCANVAINNLPTVTCHPTAAGATGGSIRVPPLEYGRTVSIGANNYGGLALGGDAGESVAMIAIDDLRLSRCALMKIDVEGMELQVLQGAAQTIKTCRPLLFVENDRPQNSAALTELLRSLDYRLYVHSEPLYNPRNFFGNTQNVFEDWRAINLLCVPDESPRRFDALAAV